MSGLGNMVDTTKVRTAEDVERKHNLDKLAKNAEILDKQVVDLTTELDNFIDTTTGNISNLQTQIDGKVELYYHSGIPSLSNYPASSWEQADYIKHVGDLYYDNDTGKAYVFELSNNVYSWNNVQDEDITTALSNASTAMGTASAAQTTANSKKRIFTSQPTTPYDVGDLWTQGSTGDIKVCNNARASGSYTASDWIQASKYTDDSSLNTFVNVTYANAMTTMNTAINEKITTWYYSGVPTLSNNPAVNWTTTEERTIHIGDLYYNQATGYVYRFDYSNSTFSWVEIHDEKAVDALSIANTAQDTADSKRRIFMAQPTPPYDNGDLWVQGDNGDIKACQVSRQTGSYVATDWILASKYTDNTYASAIVDELGGTTTTILHGQVVTEMANYTKFTDLATGGSTTIAGENITTGNIKSANYVSGVSGTNLNLTTGVISTPNATIDSDGLKLSNGAKVIGSNGLKNTYLFDNHSDKMFIGFERVYTETPSSKAKVSHIDLSIPEGLEITKAVMHLYHSPVFWYIPDELNPSQEVLEAIGYVRSLKVYKASNVQSRQIISHNSEYGIDLDETTTYTDSGCTFYNSQGVSQGASWTPTTPTQQSYAMEEAYTSDISGLFKSGDNTIPGIYELMIKSSITPPTPGEHSDYELTSRTGWVYALLEIEGYMTYS